MNDMIDHVAAAIIRKVPEGYGMTGGEAREYARAAIAAMKEPTDKMVEAFYENTEVRSTGTISRFKEGFKAMIDEALK